MSAEGIFNRISRFVRLSEARSRRLGLNNPTGGRKHGKKKKRKAQRLARRRNRR